MTPTPVEWETFLAQLAQDPEAAGEVYETLRRRLTTFFECRRFPNAPELTDEAIDRTIRASASERIANICAFAHGVARKVALEAQKRPPSEPFCCEPKAPAPEDENPLATEQRISRQLECLEKCTAQLSEVERELLFGWYAYSGKEKIAHKQALAKRFGLKSGALRTYAFRLRERVRRLCSKCLADEGLRPLVYQENRAQNGRSV